MSEPCLRLGKMSETSINITKKDVGMTLCQKLVIQNALRGKSESMDQSSATPSLHTFFGGCRRLLHTLTPTSQGLLVSLVFGKVPSLHSYQRVGRLSM